MTLDSFYNREWESDGDDEPIGSCDNCGCNIYAYEDDGSGLCDQCQWFAAMNMGDQRGDDQEEQANVG